MIFRKNDFVTHPKQDATVAKLNFGIGIVVENQRGDMVDVFFEKKGRRMLYQMSLIPLKKIRDPGDVRAFLENILVTEPKKKGSRRKPIPDQLDLFLKRFDGGIRGEILDVNEREYKVQKCDDFKSLLNEDDFQALINDNKWTELGKRISKTHNINLLSKFELIKLSDVLKDKDVIKEISKALFSFLYGSDELKIRFESYAKILGNYELDKWPIITVPLFLRFPEKYISIKPTMTKEAAENFCFNIQYDSKINWLTFSKVQEFAQYMTVMLNNEPNEQLHPRDMIDIQTIMWCTFANGWTDENISDAKKEIELAKEKE